MAGVVMADDGIAFDGVMAETAPLGGAETTFVALAEALCGARRSIGQMQFYLLVWIKKLTAFTLLPTRLPLAWMSASVNNSKDDGVGGVHPKVDPEGKLAHHRATDLTMNQRKRRRVRPDALDGPVYCVRESLAQSRLLLFVPSSRGAGFFFGLRPKDDTVSHVPSASFRRTSRQGIADLGWASCSAQRRSSSARCSNPSSSSASRSSSVRLSQRVIASSARSPAGSFSSSPRSVGNIDQSFHGIRSKAIPSGAIVSQPGFRAYRAARTSEDWIRVP
jgi:hypothetical protein